MRIYLELLDLKIFLISRLHYTLKTLFFSSVHLITYPEPKYMLFISSWVSNYMVILFTNIWKCEEDLWMQPVMASILLLVLTSRCPAIHFTNHEQCSSEDIVPWAKSTKAWQQWRNKVVDCLFEGLGFYFTCNSIRWCPLSYFWRNIKIKGQKCTKWLVSLSSLFWINAKASAKIYITACLEIAENLLNSVSGN